MLFSPLIGSVADISILITFFCLQSFETECLLIRTLIQLFVKHLQFHFIKWNYCMCALHFTGRSFTQYAVRFQCLMCVWAFLIVSMLVANSFGKRLSFILLMWSIKNAGFTPGRLGLDHPKLYVCLLKELYVLILLLIFWYWRLLLGDGLH